MQSGKGSIYFLILVIANTAYQTSTRELIDRLRSCLQGSHAITGIHVAPNLRDRYVQTILRHPAFIYLESVECL